MKVSASYHGGRLSRATKREVNRALFAQNLPTMGQRGGVKAARELLGVKVRVAR